MIQPGGTLGLLGGGQLGRMFTQRARAMGYEVVVLEPDPVSPAGAVATKHLVAPYDDPMGLAELASLAPVVTTEFENVPAAALDWLASRVICRPTGRAVATAQDRIAEKTFVRDAGLATADFEPIQDPSDLKRAWDRIGAPALLKTSRLGYDGKGQATVQSHHDAEAAFERFGRVPCVYERRLELERELSVVLARDARGAIECFPVAENVHRNGILHTTVAPAPIVESLREEALAAATRVATALGYVGVLGVELFVSAGRVFVNEIAPRPHNSGHFTMDACSVDQFEQQVRICADLPLGKPLTLSPVCMINLLGEVWSGGEPDWGSALSLPGVRLHLYGKKAVRPGRKMGHLNCLAQSPGEAHALAEEAFRRLTERPEA
ncbi:MAG: 5-(carboxyamino)imidazole ribonucleotide synthase [Gemmatimonadetes bacterium]|nr:5-(carboxyamino)imidazole ribonucleotide synthase [Gemmatimonadota bacterium]